VTLTVILGSGRQKKSIEGEIYLSCSDAAFTSDFLKQYVKAITELFIVMLEAAIYFEISVHIYKTARCHILKDKKVHFLVHRIASLTTASLKTSLL
jgi:hypothetical protein